MVTAKSQQNFSNGKFAQTMVFPKNANAQGQPEQMIATNNSTSADYDEQMAGPTVSTPENHNFQVSRLQDHKNKRIVANLSAQQLNENQDGDGNIQQIIQQQNKSSQKAKINIKFLPKSQVDGISKQQDQLGK